MVDTERTREKLGIHYHHQIFKEDKSADEAEPHRVSSRTSNNGTARTKSRTVPSRNTKSSLFSTFHFRGFVRI